MSSYIRGNKRPISTQKQPNDQPKQPERTVLHAPARSSFSHAAVGLASMMLATTSAAAQDAGTTPRQESTTPQGQKSTTTPRPDATTLPRIDVRAPRRAARPRAAPAAPRTAAPAAAEPSYQTNELSLGRVATPLRDTPQTINVVPQKLIQEQNTTSVRDALRNVSGITFRAGEGGAQGDQPYIRGFESRGDIFRDGVRDPGWYTRDSFSVDSIEVLKGPSSFLFGRGSTGGVVNIVTKTPVDRNFVETVVTGNTAPGVRGTIDANSKINENVSARIQVMGQRFDVAGRDHVEENRWGVAPSLKVKFTERTKATFSYVYQREDSVPDYGIPYLPIGWGYPRVPTPVSRNTWYGVLSAPYPDVEKFDSHIGTIKLEHEFNNNVKVTNTSRYQYVDRFQRVTAPETASGGVPFPATPGSLNTNWTPNRFQIGVKNELLANNTDFVAKFMTGFVHHTVAAGVDLSTEKRSSLRNTFTGVAATNILDPNPWRAPGTPGAPGAGQIISTSADAVGVYLADQLKVNQYFELLGGVRFDRFSFEQDANAANPLNAHLTKTDNLVSYRVGAVGHPTPNSSVYVMHGTSYNPSAEFLNVSTTNNLAGLPPEKNETTELGVKVDVLGGRLSLTSAVFETEKTNMRVAVPGTPTVMVLDGVARVRGFEAGAVGHVTKRWQVFFSYTYLDSRITRTLDPALLNTELLNTPNHTLSLWTTYDINDKLTLGGGAYYVGSMWGNAQNNAAVPDYWRFDAMASYKITKHATLQFNIYNIFDKYYFGSAYNNWAVPGPSRYAALALKYRY